MKDEAAADAFMRRYRAIARLCPWLSPDEAWARYQQECLRQIREHYRKRQEER